VTKTGVSFGMPEGRVWPDTDFHFHERTSNRYQFEDSSFLSLSLVISFRPHGIPVLNDTDIDILVNEHLSTKKNYTILRFQFDCARVFTCNKGF